jgi:Fur family iron response transcriptional regulator
MTVTGASRYEFSTGPMRSIGSKSLSPNKSDLVAKLRGAALRPTRQRLALGKLLFSAGDRHVTAEGLHAEATKSGAHLSLATVYNTLHQFTGAGLLRQVIVDGDKTYFDTNTGDHHHFYFEDRQLLTDIPGDCVQIAGLPKAPQGTEIERVEVVVRLKSRD